MRIFRRKGSPSYGLGVAAILLLVSPMPTSFRRHVPNLLRAEIVFCILQTNVE